MARKLSNLATFLAIDEEATYEKTTVSRGFLDGSPEEVPEELVDEAPMSGEWQVVDMHVDEESSCDENTTVSRGFLDGSPEEVLEKFEDEAPMPGEWQVVDMDKVPSFAREFLHEDENPVGWVPPPPPKVDKSLIPYLEIFDEETYKQDFTIAKNFRNGDEIKLREDGYIEGWEKGWPNKGLGTSQDYKPLTWFLAKSSNLGSKREEEYPSIGEESILNEDGSIVFAKIGGA